MPPKADLSFTGLDDFVYTSTAVTKDASKSNEVFVEKPKEVKSGAPLIQAWDTDSDNESIFRPNKFLKKLTLLKKVSMLGLSNMQNQLKLLNMLNLLHQLNQFNKLRNLRSLVQNLRLTKGIGMGGWLNI